MRDFSRLKKTKRLWQLNTVYDPGSDPGHLERNKDSHKGRYEGNWESMNPECTWGVITTLWLSLEAAINCTVTLGECPTRIAVFRIEVPCCVQPLSDGSAKGCVWVCVQEVTEGRGRERDGKRGPVWQNVNNRISMKGAKVFVLRLWTMLWLKISKVRSTYVCAWHEIYICNNRKHKLRQAAYWPAEYSSGSSAQCYVEAWMGGEFGGERIHLSVWLNPFAVHLELSQHC